MDSSKSGPSEPTAVQLRSGPPTRQELVTFYPHKFSWNQLRAFVNSGDLGLLKRDRELQKRYNEWSAGIKQEHGSIVNYLLQVRLQFGEPDTLSLLGSALDGPRDPPQVAVKPTGKRYLPSIPPDAPQYFTAYTPASLLSVIQNDWPYSVPPEVEHTLIWTRLPIFHPSLIPSAISARVEQDGLWGFTGMLELPPSPSTIPDCLPALSEWGITLDKLIVSQKGTPEEDESVRLAGREVDQFVRNRWDEERWETAWFVNPPRLQSVKGLAHIHVFAKQK